VLAGYTSAAFTTTSGVAVAALASVEVRREDTNALASIWSDEAGLSVLANPFSADSSGRFAFYAAGLRRGFKVTVTPFGGGTPVVLRNQAVGIAGQLDATAYGESLMNAASEVDATQILHAQRKLFSMTGAVVSNSGAGAQDLVTYTMPANTLASGRGIKIIAWGIMASKATAFQAKVYFGATAVATLTNIASEATNWRHEVEVIATGVNAERASNLTTAQGVTVAGLSVASFPALAEVLSGSIDVKIRAEGVLAAGDVTAQGLIVEVLN
jgi:hypothetical protein